MSTYQLTPFFYYESNVTLSSKDLNDPQTLNSINSAVAGQATAPSGEYRTEFNSEAEFVAYNLGLPFGRQQNNDVKGMAQLLARYVMGVVAAAAQTNPKLTIIGD